MLVIKLVELLMTLFETLDIENIVCKGCSISILTDKETGTEVVV